MNTTVNVVNVEVNKIVEILEKKIQKMNVKYEQEELSILKGIIEYEQKLGKVLTVEKTFATVKQLLSSETSIERVCILCELLTHLSTITPSSFFRNFAPSLSQLYKKTLNTYHEKDFIVLQCIELFYHLLKAFSNETEWREELNEIFFVGMFQFIKDENAKIRVKSTKLIGSLIGMKKKVMNVNIGKIILSSISKKDLEKKELLYILRFISGVFFKLPSNFFIEISMLFMNNLIYVRECQEIIFKIFNKFFNGTKVILPVEYVVKIVKALLINYKIKEEKSYIFMLKNAFLKMRTLHFQTFYEQLPILFKVFVSNYKTKNKEISSAVTECLKELILTTVNSEFIDDAYAKKGNSCLWKMVVEVKNGLNFFNVVNVSLVLDVMQQFFLVLGMKSFPMMSSVVKELNGIHEKSSPIVQRSIEVTIGVCVSAMGPQRFFSIVPFNSFFNIAKAQDLSEIWIIPVMLSYVQNTELKYFFSFFMPIAKKILDKANSSQQEGKEVEGFKFRNLSVQIWNLFPRFCIIPVDLPNVFDGLVDNLLNLVNTNLVLSPIVLRGFTKLVTSNQKVIKDGKVPKFRNYNIQRAKESLGAIAKHSKKLLDILFPLFLSGKVSKQLVGNSISAILSISNRDIIVNYFKTIISNILEALKRDKAKRGKKVEDVGVKEDFEAMNLAVSLVPYLPPPGVEMFFSFLKGLLAEKNSTIQKKIYKALFRISESYPNFVKSKETEIYKLVISNVSTCNPSSAKYRFKLIVNLFNIISREVLQHGVREIIGESVLGTMSNNAEARDYSRVVLNTLVKKLVFDRGNMNIENVFELNGEQKGNLTNIFKIIFAGLGGGTLMIAGTINGFTYLCKEYYRFIKDTIFLTIMKSVLKLLKLKSPEVFSSCLYFIKMMIKRVNKITLKVYCPQMVVDMISQYENHSAGNKRMIVRLILEKLIRIFDYEYVKNLFSSMKDHMVVLKAVKAQMKSKEKKKKKKKKAKRKKEKGDEGTLRMKLTNMGDEPVNFFESKAIESIKYTRKLRENEYMKTESNEKFEVVVENEKFVIREKNPEVIKENVEKEEIDPDEEFIISGRKRTFDDIGGMDDYEEEDSDLSHTVKKLKVSDDFARELNYVGKSEYYIRNREKQRKKDEKWKKINFGASFRSKDGRSDITKEKQPFAYLPLTHDVLNKRNSQKPTAFDKYQNLQKRKRSKRKRKKK